MHHGRFSDADTKMYTFVSSSHHSVTDWSRESPPSMAHLSTTRGLQEFSPLFTDRQGSDAKVHRIFVHESVVSEPQPHDDVSFM